MAPPLLTVDACVWVAAFEPADALHPAARAFLIECQRRHVPLASPTIALLETGCAISRRFGSPEKGRRAARLWATNPLLHLMPVDAELEAHALELGTALRLRAADALYAALAARLDADLLTTDGELLDRTAGYVRASTPARWLEAHAERP
ncbi:MAG: PIN domain-containing protein [Ardenticatenales bacterium]